MQARCRFSGGTNELAMTAQLEMEACEILPGAEMLAHKIQARWRVARLFIVV